MSYQYQQPAGEAQQAQQQPAQQQQQQSQQGQQGQQGQQPASGNASPVGESAAPGFNQQATGGSQNGSENMGEKTTLWYVTDNLIATIRTVF